MKRIASKQSGLISSGQKSKKHLHVLGNAMFSFLACAFLIIQSQAETFASFIKDASLPLTGVNIAGGEFGWTSRSIESKSLPQYGVDYCYPTKPEIDCFAGQGMNFFHSHPTGNA